MPRNGSGVMSKPPNTTAQPNTTIRSAMFNSVIDDFIQDANDPRPITAGGTGASNIVTMRDNFELDRKVMTKAVNAAYTAVKADNNAIISVTADATVSIDTALNVGTSWHAWIVADGGVATIDPSGSQKINGANTLVLQNGQSAFVFCTGVVGDEFTAVAIANGQLPYAEKAGAYMAVASDNRGTLYFTATATLSLTAAATLGNDWRVRVVAGNGPVTIDPNSSELINGAATLVLQTDQVADIICTGTAFRAVVSGNPLSGPQLQGYSYGLALATNATDAANDVDIGVGAAAADASPYALMQLTTAITKRIDAAWVVGTNQGGLDTGVVAASGTYYLWLIQRSDTGIVDVLFSLSAISPTMPANYDRKRLFGRVTRTASINGNPGPSGPGFYPAFVSSPMTVTLGANGLVSHGLPSAPRKVSAYAIMTVAFGPFAVGDMFEIRIDSNGSNNGYGVQVSIPAGNSTQVRYQVGNVSLATYLLATGAQGPGGTISVAQAQLIIIAEL